MTADPSRLAFDTHVTEPAFLAGQDNGRWRVVVVKWPLVTVLVRAGRDRMVGLRLDLNGYPAAAPTGAPWDVEADSPLPAGLWPVGPRTSMVFNPSWNPSALYHPFDRLAQLGHEGWSAQHPQHVWNPARTLTDYLKLVTDVLRDVTPHGHAHG